MIATERNDRSGEAGYVLFGIVIMVVILGIGMGAAAPVWHHVIQREKEEELIWRGNQYVQALGLYQRRYPGAFPPNLEILVEQKFLRKLYKDPMTEDGEWKIIRQMSPEARGITGLAPQQPGTTGRGQPGRESTQQRQQRSPRSRLGGLGEEALGGIVGVVSTSEEEAIRIWNGKEAYNEWLFVYMAQGQRGRGRGGPGARQPGVRQPEAQRPGLPGAQPPGSPGAPQRPPSMRRRPPSQRP